MKPETGFGFGVLVGVVIALGINLLPWSYLSKYHQAISACEKNLPRSQKCAITATPDQPTLKGE